MWELLLSPPAAIGCLVGVALAVLLHWAFPGQDLLFGQTLIVAACFAVGLAFDLLRGKGRQR
jgi:hypothetical protein